MAARNYNNQMINSSEWNDAVDSTSLPLTNSGNYRLTFNTTTNELEIYINGNLVAVIDADGNYIKKRA